MKQFIKMFLLGIIGVLLTVISFFMPSGSLRKWTRIIAAVLVAIDVIRTIRQLILNRSVKPSLTVPANQVAAVVADTLTPSTNNAVALIVAQNVDRSYSAIPKGISFSGNTTTAAKTSAYDFANKRLF